jgi:hypothetical protein
MGLKSLVVFIADSNLSPFPLIKEGVRDIHNSLKSESTNVYYLRPQIRPGIEPKISVLSNRLRYTKYWPIQYLFDRLTICSPSLKSPNYLETSEDICVNGSKEGLRYLGRNFIAAVQYAYTKDYEFLLKTTISSVFSKDKLHEFLESQDNSLPLYAGRKVDIPNGNRRKNFSFVSGSCILINRLAMKIILEEAKIWDHGKLDDVALGKIMHQKVKISPFTSIDVPSIEVASTLEKDAVCNIIHYRCKSQENPRNDSKIMNLVFNKLL